MSPQTPEQKQQMIALDRLRKFVLTEITQEIIRATDTLTLVLKDPIKRDVVFFSLGEVLGQFLLAEGRGQSELGQTGFSFVNPITGEDVVLPLAQMREGRPEVYRKLISEASIFLDVWNKFF